MRTRDYFQSLAIEVEALKDRVRYLIEDQHWQTDGEWKESVIRQVLRRHLPQSVSVSRGFIVTASTASRQIDVLIVDSSKPVLFRDGDLVFVTPRSGLGGRGSRSCGASPEAAVGGATTTVFGLSEYRGRDCLALSKTYRGVFICALALPWLKIGS
jgi:hypothetical protein